MNRVFCVFGGLDYDIESAISKAIKEILGDKVRVSMFHRDYQFESTLQQAKPVLVISNGVTKTRFDDESVTIYFSARKALAKSGCDAAIISHTFFGFYIDWLFRLKLRCFKWFSSSSPALA